MHPQRRKEHGIEISQRVGMRMGESLIDAAVMLNRDETEKVEGSKG